MNFSQTPVKIFVFSALCLWVSLALTGCHMTTDYDPKTFAQTNQSIVILRSYAKHLKDDKGREKLAPQTLKSTWNHRESGEQFSVHDTKRDLNLFSGTALHAPQEDNSDQFFVCAIKPGQYTLESIYFYIPSHFAQVFPDNAIKFDIKPKEIIYIGDIIYDRSHQGSDSTPPLIIRDSFADAQQFLNKQYPELATSLRSKIIQVTSPILLRTPGFMGRALDYFYFISRLEKQCPSKNKEEQKQCVTQWIRHEKNLLPDEIEMAQSYIKEK